MIVNIMNLPIDFMFGLILSCIEKIVNKIINKHV